MYDRHIEERIGGELNRGGMERERKIVVICLKMYNIIGVRTGVGGGGGVGGVRA